MAEATPTINPIEQFHLHRVLRIVVGDFDVSITNSSLYMGFIALGLFF